MLLLFYDHAAKHGRIAELGLDSFGAGDVAESLLQVRPPRGRRPLSDAARRSTAGPTRWCNLSIWSTGSGWCSCSARWGARA